MAAPLDAPWNNNILADATLAEVTVGKGTSFPSTWEVGRMFLRTDLESIHFNSGTEGTPVWTPVSGVPVGAIQAFGGEWDDLPAGGWFYCNDQAVSRTTFAALFAVIGTSFGIGDGSTTFNVPDLRDTFSRGAPNETTPGSTGGADTHTLSTAEMPAHTHSVTQPSGTQASTAGQFIGAGTAVLTTGSTGGGGSHNNVPAHQDVTYMIKH